MKLFGLSKKYFRSIVIYVRYLLLSDATFLKLKFKKVFGYSLDLNNPKTLNEKIQYMKINVRRPEYLIFADKYKVRDYIRQKIGDKYLIPLFSIHKRVDELQVDALPDTPFIVKTNHDCSGGVIVKNKRDLDMVAMRNIVSFNLWNNHYYVSREIHYKNIERLILIEKLLVCSNGKIPNDIKINCFNGKAEFIYCSIDREGKDYRKIYDTDWNELDFKWGSKSSMNSKFLGEKLKRPKNLDEMLKISEVLSEGFPYLRIDLYDVDGDIYVGEITIYHGAGFDVIEPYSVDLKYGHMIDIVK